MWQPARRDEPRQVTFTEAVLQCARRLPVAVSRPGSKVGTTAVLLPVSVASGFRSLRSAMFPGPRCVVPGARLVCRPRFGSRALGLLFFIHGRSIYLCNAQLSMQGQALVRQLEGARAQASAHRHDALSATLRVEVPDPQSTTGRWSAASWSGHRGDTECRFRTASSSSGRPGPMCC